MSRSALALLGAALLSSIVTPGAMADAAQDACKKAQNARIQVCTDDCTKAALKAASNYVDKNNNVKFGCLKGCALRQVMQMRACGSDGGPPPDDPTETNR